MSAIRFFLEEIRKGKSPQEVFTEHRDKILELFRAESQYNFSGERSFHQAQRALETVEGKPEDYIFFILKLCELEPNFLAHAKSILISLITHGTPRRLEQVGKKLCDGLFALLDLPQKLEIVAKFPTDNSANVDLVVNHYMRLWNSLDVSAENKEKIFPRIKSILHNRVSAADAPSVLAVLKNLTDPVLKQRLLHEDDSVSLRVSLLRAHGEYQYKSSFLRIAIAIFNNLDLDSKKMFLDKLTEQGAVDKQRNMLSALDQLMWTEDFGGGRIEPELQSEMRNLILDQFLRCLQIFNPQERSNLIGDFQHHLFIIHAYCNALYSNRLDIITKMLEIDPLLEVDNAGRELDPALVAAAATQDYLVDFRQFFIDISKSRISELFFRPSPEILLLQPDPHYRQSAENFYAEIFRQAYTNTFAAVQRVNEPDNLTQDDISRIAALEARRLTLYVVENKEKIAQAFQVAQNLALIRSSGYLNDIAKRGSLTPDTAEFPLEMEVAIVEKILPPYDKKISRNDLNFLSAAKKDRLPLQNLTEEISKNSQRILRDERCVAGKIVERVQEIGITSRDKPAAAVSGGDASHLAQALGKVL